MKSFWIEPIFKCTINYNMALLFLVAGNIFIYFLILDNIFNINWGPDEFSVRIIFWLFAEFLLLILTRVICIIRNNNNNNTYNSENDALLI